MPSNVSRRRVGIFVLACLGLLALVVLVVGGISLLSKDKIYYVRFKESVGKLEESSVVTYKGVPVGRVADVRFAKDDITNIEVVLRINPDVKVKVDTRAKIQTQWLTNVSTIELFGGTNEAVELLTEEEIPAEPSLWDALFNSGNELLINLTNTFGEENRIRIASFLDNLNALSDPGTGKVPLTVEVLARTAESLERATEKVAKLADELVALVKENRQTLRDGVKGLSAAAGRMEEVFAGEDFKTTVVNFKEASASIREMGEKLEPHKVLQKVEEAAERVSDLALQLQETLGAERGDIYGTIASFREGAEEFRELLAALRTSPSLLLFSALAREREIPDKEEER